MIICLSLLGFAFFRNANQYLRLGIFLCLFAGVVAFGFSIRNATSMSDRGSTEIEAHFTITDTQPHTYRFTFVCVKDTDGKIWISLKEDSGGWLDGRNYDLYLSNVRREVQLPIPTGAGVYAFGKLSLISDENHAQSYIYFDGGLHATDGTERSISHAAVCKVDGIVGR
jgi:hypothetical protein